MSAALLHPGLQFPVCKVFVAVVDRLELTAVGGHDRLGEQVQASTQHHELTADTADCLAVVLAEVRHQSSRQPDQFDVALSLALQATTRVDTIQISVDVDLQQCRRVVGRPARRFRLCALEARVRKSSSPTNASTMRTGLS